MKMQKKTLLTVLVIVAVAVIVLWLTVFRNGQGDKIVYRKEAISRGDVEALVTTTGTVNPIEIVDVGSQVSGKVVKLNVDFNSQVEQGQIVAELDQEPLRMKVDQNEASYKTSLASLERAKLNRELSEKKFERAKSLFEKNLISYEEMETAEANYLSAKSDVVSNEAGLARAKSTLDLSKVDLEYAIIRSPVDGIVISRSVSVGQTVQASFQAPVLFQVATDLTKMKVECSVDEADIGKVKEGQNVRFTVEAFPEEPFNGIVQQVRYSPIVESNVVTYTTVVNVDNLQKKLRPGMTATVSIIVGEAHNALRVPNSAIRFTPDLSDADMQRLAAEMREKIGTRRPQAANQGGSQSGQATPESSQGGIQTAPAGQSGGTRMAFQGAGQGRMTEGQSGQRRQASRVWLEEEGKLRMVFIRTGVTDGNYTELLGGQLNEGDEVIIGTATAGSANTSAEQSRGGRPPMMMFR